MRQPSSRYAYRALSIPLLPTERPAVEVPDQTHANEPQKVTLRRVLWLIVGAFLVGYMAHTPPESSYREREMERARWNVEEEMHERWVSKGKAQKQRWEEDQRRRDEKDKLDREEHENKRHEIQWQAQERHNCIRYGTREYSATLANVPLGFNAIDECANKTLWFNGREVRPTRCENPGFCGHVIGHWEIDFNEPYCKPSWGDITNRGCWPDGSRMKRYDAELDNNGELESWKEVCSSMSAKWWYVDLPAGQAQCTQSSGRYWATWYLQDDSC